MIKLKNIGKYVPKGKMTNKDFEKIVDTSDEWIYSRTGIKVRNIAFDETHTEIAYNAIKSMNEDLSDVDLIIVATTTSENKTPQTSTLLQGLLGLKERDVICFDINAACTGFLYAIETARCILKSKENVKKAIVVGCECLSKITNYEDRNTCVLFGDGAGCVLLEKTSESNQVFEGFLSAQADDKELLLAKNPALLSIENNTKTEPTSLYMNGREVFKFAVKAMQKSINKVLEINNMELSDIDFIIPHQANVRIIEKASTMLNYPLEQFYMNLETHGNSSAASIPMALYDAVNEGKIKKGNKVLLVGFGGGLSYGAIIVTI